jgi:hypothetical protein
MERRDADKHVESMMAPCVEGEERRSVGRRVSFAPATEIRYLAGKEEGSKSESSSMENMSIEATGRRSSMEITAIHSEHSFSLRENDSLPLCEEEGEKNFIMEDSDESTEESKRMSMCPVAEEMMDTTGIVRRPEEEKSMEIVSDMLSEIVGAEEGNTLYDTVNVEEVLRRGKKKIREIVAEAGIRFLDNLSMSSRRETLSKIRNQVPGTKCQYFEKFLKKRVEFYCEFALELAKEIEEKRGVLRALEGRVYEGEMEGGEGAFSLRLRQMKADARRKSKVQWHILRLAKEDEFGEGVGRARDEMREELLNMKAERMSVEREIGSIDICKLEREEKEVSIPEGSLAEIEKYTEASREQEAVLRSLETEEIELKKRMEALEDEEKSIEREVEEEGERVALLERRDLRGEVCDEDLRRVREETKAIESVFGVKFKLITDECVLVEICLVEIQIHFRVLGKGTEILSLSAQGTLSPFMEFSARGAKARAVGLSLEEGVRNVFRYILLFHSLEKEIKLLGMKCPYEVRVEKQEMKVVFEVKRGRGGEMGSVEVLFVLGSDTPRFSTNIKGISPHGSYGSITDLLSQACSATRQPVH